MTDKVSDRPVDKVTDQVSTHSIGKDSIGKDRIVEVRSANDDEKSNF